MKRLLALFLIVSPCFASDIQKVGSVYKCTLGDDEIEIGDIKDTKFVSKFKIKKWGEDELSLIYDAAGQDGPVDGKAKVKFDKVNTRIYKLSDDAIEFEVILNTPPASNIFTFYVRGWENFDWYYQGPLSADEIAGGAYRPENVVGSYAVYHKTKKNYRVGGKNYKTGKAGHLYRPETIDANGERMWCDWMNFSAGTITVCASAAWLSTAAYPAILDPTFGVSSEGATFETATNHLYTTTGTLTVTGTVTSISVLVQCWLGGAESYNIKVGMYDATAISTPSVRSIPETALNVPAADRPKYWETIDCVDTELSAGLKYFAFVTDGNFLKTFYDTIGPKRYYKWSFSYATAFPQIVTWDIDTLASRKYSIYATYTTAATTSASPPAARGRMLE